MKILGRVLGAVGGVFLLAVPIMFFAVGASWNWLFTVQVTLGVGFVAFYVATNLGEVGRIATGRGTFYLAFTAVSTALVLALVIAANYAASKAKVTKDLTESGIFTLAPDSVETVKSLPEPVEILAFYRSDAREYRVLAHLVDRYRGHSEKLSLVEVDPAKEPLKVKQHNVSLWGNRIVAVMGERSEKIDEISEEGVTNALVRLTRGAAKKVYFTAGHGEADPDDQETERGYGLVAAAMANEGLEVATLELVNAGSVPDDAAAVVVAGPRAAFLEPELKALDGYLAAGGRLLVLLEPMAPSGLEPLLEKYGVQVDDDLVLDVNQLSQVMGTGPAVPFVTQFAKHAITERFAGANGGVLLPTARSLTALNVEGAERPLPLALSQPTAWGETDLSPAPKKYDDGEKRGPLPLALVATRPLEGGERTDEARLLVVGDSEFAANQWAEQLMNADLFLNGVNWLAEQVDRLTIRARRRASSSISLTAEEGMLLGMLSINVLPLTLAALGVAVWVLRKNR